MPSVDPLYIFVACPPGHETMLSAEVAALGYTGTPTPGGLELTGNLQTVYRLNWHSRLASRVLVRVGRFMAREFWQLHKQAAKLPWEQFLRPGQPVAVRATSHHARLFHSDAVAERVARAIGDRLGQPTPLQSPGEEESDQPPATIIARLVDNQCTLSVDSSGALLHRRGWRQATAKAPLRETLAAWMLWHSGWDAVSPLLDPLCGSGTIAIEAALMARGVPAGTHRTFAFEQWPIHDAALWKYLRRPRRLAGPTPFILAADRDAGAMAAARANAERAGVADLIQFACQPLSALQAPALPGWLVTNPPYGHRLGEDVRDLYARLGQMARTHLAGWHVAALCPTPVLARAAGWDFASGAPTHNGGLAVRLLHAPYPSG